MRSSTLRHKCFSSPQTAIRLGRQFEPVLTTPQPFHQTPLQESSRVTGRRRNSTFQAATSKDRKVRLLKPAAVTLAVLCTAVTGWYAFTSGSDDDGSLNQTKFTVFNIVSREQVSPTAFILTIRCPDEELVKSKNAAKVKAAWEHGLWSLEIKQPQLQIARHYTPLPPSEKELDSADHVDELRFLIRRMDGGEMSNYLSKLKVGDKVWLRGPHYGFDVTKRLGDAEQVVFLAGGTGIAPALQLAHKTLNAAHDGPGSTQPRIHVLWANRRSEDAVGRDELRGSKVAAKGFWGWGSSSIVAKSTPSNSLLCRQMLEMKRKYGDRFGIHYFVDEENTFIGIKDVDAAMGNPMISRMKPEFAPAGRDCRWHSPEILATSSDEEDSIHVTKSPCTCPKTESSRIGRNLICVSGPDGFIEAFSGSKRWLEGREMQGPTRGLIGTLRKQGKGSIDDWLVLKL